MKVTDTQRQGKVKNTSNQSFKSTRTPEKRRTKERKREKRKLRRTILKQPPFPSAFWRLEERERGREMATDERQAREDGYAHTEEKEQRQIA